MVKIIAIMVRVHKNFKYVENKSIIFWKETLSKVPLIQFEITPQNVTNKTNKTEKSMIIDRLIAFISLNFENMSDNEVKWRYNF